MPAPSPSDTGRTSAYRPDIDGLRGIAVLAVILNHINEDFLPLGYLGVDVFFVISGYVITRSLLQKQHLSPRQFLKEFYARRIRRIMPALLVCIVITALLISLLSPKADESLQTGMAAIFGLSNLQLMERSSDYFASSTKLNAFTHTWSLGVEEQFYFYYPLIFAMAFAARPSRKLISGFLVIAASLAAALLASKLLLHSTFALVPGGLFGIRNYLPYALLACLIPLTSISKRQTTSPNSFKASQQLITILALTAIGAFAYFNKSYTTNFAAAYYGMPARFWELALGCLLMLLAWQKPSEDRHEAIGPWRRIGQTVALPLTLLAFLLPSHLGQWATALIVALSGLILHTSRPGNVCHRLLTASWLRRVGLISYSLYLWHWSVLCLSRWTIGIHWWSIPLQLLAMFGLAAASYRWIETPFRHSRLPRDAGRTFRIGAAAAVAALAMVGGLKAQAKQISLDQRLLNQRSSGPAPKKQPFITDKIANHLEPQKLYQKLTHDADGQPLKRPRVYVIGDSHSEHYISSLAKAMPERGIGNGSTGWRCGYIARQDIEPLTRQWMNGCENYKPSLDQFLEANLEPRDVVLVAHRWREKKNKPHEEQALSELASLVQRKQAYLLLLDDVPELKVDDPILCMRRPWRPFPFTGCSRSLADLDRDQRPMDLLAERLRRVHPDVEYISLRHLYCEKNDCGAYKGNVFLYQDNNHLSPEASLLGARVIASRIHALAGR